jgi:glycosyltransferase involved in cell wall biosynthesis
MSTADAATELPPPPSDKQPKVAILMGTFNGQRFLREQLDSIRQQTHTNWELYISDDGSIDDTLRIIKSVGPNWPSNPVSLWPGPRKGFVANFLSLACNPAVDADYYAFSDQDDIWESDKLERAIKRLKATQADKPAMHCSRTKLIDAEGKPIGFSPLFEREPSFKNALVQSIAGANTMVFNHAARSLLTAAGYENPIVSHDWWVYLLVTGSGGDVFYDPTPDTKYRQHSSNLVGSNVGLRAMSKRLRASFRGRFKNWNEMNLRALELVEQKFPIEHRKTLDNFRSLRVATTARRLRLIADSGIYRQTFIGNIFLFGAACLGKI